MSWRLLGPYLNYIIPIFQKIKWRHWGQIDSIHHGASCLMSGAFLGVVMCLDVIWRWEREASAPHEVEALAPGNIQSLRSAETGVEWLQRQKPIFPCWFLKTPGKEQPILSRVSQRKLEPPGLPQAVTVWLLSWPRVSKGTFQSKTFTAFSLYGMQWRGWLSTVTSVKTQPSSGNSLYFVLLLESNYHLVVCYWEVVFFCLANTQCSSLVSKLGAFRA